MPLICLCIHLSGVTLPLEQSTQTRISYQISYQINSADQPLKTRPKLEKTWARPDSINLIKEIQSNRHIDIYNCITVASISIIVPNTCLPALTVIPTVIVLLRHRNGTHVSMFTRLPYWTRAMNKTKKKSSFQHNVWYLHRWVLLGFLQHYIFAIYMYRSVIILVIGTVRNQTMRHRHELKTQSETIYSHTRKQNVYCKAFQTIKTGVDILKISAP